MDKHKDAGTYDAPDDWRVFDPGGPWTSRLRQGQIGDCYLMAVMAAIAVKDKRYLRSIIREAGDRLYEVRLFVPLANGKYRPEWVTVDTCFPKNDHGRWLYARLVRSPRTGLPVIWAAFVQKAVAKLNEEHKIFKPNAGYQGIGKGASSARAFEVLTGHRSRVLWVKQASDGQVWSEFQRAANGDYMTASTFAEGPGIYDNHAYTVIGIEYSDGQRLVKMRNPWGRKSPANLYGGDGVFAISLPMFRTYYHRIVRSRRCSPARYHDWLGRPRVSPSQ